MREIRSGDVVRMKGGGVVWAVGEQYEGELYLYREDGGKVMIEAISVADARFVLELVADGGGGGGFDRGRIVEFATHFADSVTFDLVFQADGRVSVLSRWISRFYDEYVVPDPVPPAPMPTPTPPAPQPPRPVPPPPVIDTEVYV